MRKAIQLAGLAMASMISASASGVLLGQAPGGPINDGPFGCGSSTGGTATEFGSINVYFGLILAANAMEVNVHGLSHTWRGDLQITLIGPMARITR